MRKWQKAIEEASKAAEAWKSLAEIADENYKVQLLARTRKLDWVNTIKNVEGDIEIVKSSTGEEPKFAKIFITGDTKVDVKQREKLELALKSKGYKVENYAGWKVEAYAAGLKVAIAHRDDLITQFYTSRGGTFDADYEKKGYLIEKLNHKLWLIGETSEDCSKGVDELIRKLEAEL